MLERRYDPDVEGTEMDLDQPQESDSHSPDAQTPEESTDASYVRDEESNADGPSEGHTPIPLNFVDFSCDEDADADSVDLPAEEATEPPACEVETAESNESSPDAASAAMRTLLRNFSEAFRRDIAPGLAPLDSTIEALSEADSTWSAAGILPHLRDVRQQIQSLIDRAAQQQAYVLIFGPLKSGKSTFMNAVCSAYVSEVTSLPAYPCIVNVRHAESSGFTTQRYNGREERFEAPEAMRELISEAHEQLMNSVREVESGGDQFDPSLHMPEAIRAIDVNLPTGDLADSGAVLVDTPGLYTRMKFGYDRITREFRNAAACAIFIVKADNLFFEKVFEEFQELLDMFSRVFLIVNVDSTKKDLSPDGQLVPSLESTDPQQVIQAFHDLSMTAPLHAAADGGRLSIYAVDLLAAACARMHSGQGEEIHDDHIDSERRFSELLTDLTDYINSNEYLRAFLSDSLRRTDSLLEELSQLAGHQAVDSLTEAMSSVKADLTETESKFSAVNRLGEVDWNEQLREVRESLIATCGEAVTERRQKSAAKISAEIDRWFETDASLADLSDEGVHPRLRSAAEKMASCVYQTGRELLTGDAGPLSSSSAASDAAKVGMNLSFMAEHALSSAQRDLADAPVRWRFPSARVPVKRKFSDWIMLRSQEKVRERLFGSADHPDKAVVSKEKVERLGDEARKTMTDLACTQLERVVEPYFSTAPERFIANCAASLAEQVRREVESTRQHLQEHLGDLRSRMMEGQNIADAFESLRDDVATIRQRADALRSQFGPSDPPLADESENTPEPPTFELGLDGMYDV